MEILKQEILHNGFCQKDDHTAVLSLLNHFHFHFHFHFIYIYIYTYMCVCVCVCIYIYIYKLLCHVQKCQNIYQVSSQEMNLQDYLLQHLPMLIVDHLELLFVFYHLKNFQRCLVIYLLLHFIWIYK